MSTGLTGVLHIQTKHRLNLYHFVKRQSKLFS